MDQVEEMVGRCSIKIEEIDESIYLEAQVRWFHSDDVKKEVEIKAVTRQDLSVLNCNLVRY